MDAAWVRLTDIHQANRIAVYTCTYVLVLEDSIAVCLLKLGLPSAPDQVITELGNGNSSDSYTVFATDGGVLAHIVNGTVGGKHLTHGKVLQTLMPDVWLHVGRVSKVYLIDGTEQ